MINSIITCGNDWTWYEEMLIPVCIGAIKAGHFIKERLNRMLPAGHRWRGDVR